MSEKCQQSLSCNPEDLRQALSVHTRKITDSCRDKDCIEDLRVYLTTGSQTILDSATGAKVRSADLLYTAIDVEPAGFDTKHYYIDVTFFYRILADAVIPSGRPTCLYGLALFSKRVVLCGEESKAHVYKSNALPGPIDSVCVRNANLPTAVVEVLDPMVLSSKVTENCQCACDCPLVQIPDAIAGLFDEALVINGENRRLLVTLGQFSIIRLERDAQLIVPVVDYAIPTKECCDAPGCAEDPCELFSRIPFPEAQFAPRDCDRQQPCDCYTTT